MPRRKPKSITTQRERFRDVLAFETASGMIKLTARGKLTSQEMFQISEHTDILALQLYRDERQAG